MNKKKMIEDLEQELYLKEKGHVSTIEIFPGGTKDGLDYGPVVVEIVVLDGDAIAYRVSTDVHDEDWEIGSIEDAVDETTGYYEQAKDAEKLSYEEWKASLV